MNLDHLATRLDTLGVGKKAKTLFLHMMPADATQALLLRSPLAGTPINHELPGLFHAEFQVIVRSTDFDSGKKLIRRAVEALSLAPGEVLGNQTFNYCRPRTQPVAFPMSAGSLIEHSVTFAACFVED